MDKSLAWLLTWPRPAVAAALVNGIIMLLVILLLGGCAGFTQAGVDAARRAADTAASVFVADTCAMTLGAYHRLENQNHRLGATLICDPNARAPITAEDVLRLMR